MKKVYVLLLTMLLGTMQAVAQEKNKCEKAYAALTERAAARAYDEAFVQLAFLRKDCPKLDIGIYETGENILRYKYESSNVPADKETIAADLIKLYAEQQANFPGSGADVKKALFLNETKKADDKQTFKILDDAFAANASQFKDYRAFELYFNLYLKQYEAQVTGVTIESFIKKYGDITAQIAAEKTTVNDKRNALQKKLDDGAALEAAETAYLTNTKNTVSVFDAVADNMAKQVALIFSCEKLEAYYNDNFEKNKDNVAWVNGMVHTLKELRCSRSKLLFEGIKLAYKLNPTYDATYDLAYYNQKNGDGATAARLYTEAAEKQPAPSKKAGIYMAIAQLYRSSDKAKAKEFAMKAAATDAKNGSPYLFIAEMYMTAGAECGLSPLEKKALTFAAIDQLKKAEVAEAKYKTTVAKLEEDYSKNIPTKKEAKAEKKGRGDTITYGCWINESVTLPKLK